MLNFDVTPTTATVYNERRGGEETSVGDFNKERTALRGTSFIEFHRQVPLLKRETDATATAQELRAGGRQPPMTRDLDDAEVVKVRDARLALLARKYEGMTSIEDTARLQILTERLRKLAPRVTSKDVEQVAELVSDAEGIAVRLEGVKKKFGLR